MKNNLENKPLLKTTSIAILIIVIVLLTNLINTNKTESAVCGSADCMADYYYKKLDILVLGDSFSAGNGLGRSRSFRNDGCYRNENNWISKFSNWLYKQDIPNSVENRACSGAVTKDILEKREWKSGEYKGSGYLTGWSESMTNEEVKELIKNQHCKSDRFYNSPAEAVVANIDFHATKVYDNLAFASFKCSLALREQSYWVDPRFDAVFLTIGGNDLGFSKLIKTCVTMLPKYSYLIKPFCPVFIEQAFNELDYLKDKIIDVLEKINQSGLREDAKIILVGYPLMSLDNQHWLGDLALPKYFRQIGKELNQLQAEAVREFNQKNPNKAYFVDNVQEYFAGHEPNLNIFLPNPSRWITNVLEPSLDFNHWFHPNERGHQAYAEILQKLANDGVIEPISNTGKNMDIVFNIDTNSTMALELQFLKAHIKQIAEKIQWQSKSARFAISSFKQNLGSIATLPYSFQTNLHFTRDINQLAAEIDKLTANGLGGVMDKRPIWSSLDQSLNQNWRTNVEKVVITLTDSKPYDIDPLTNSDKKKVAKTAFELDPVKLYFIITGESDLEDYYREIAEESSGMALIEEKDTFGESLGTILDHILAKPHAWLNGPHVAKFGETITFDARSSFGTVAPIVQYEWDLDGDGNYETTTVEPTIEKSFDSYINTLAAVRINDQHNNVNVANTHLLVSDDGDDVPRDQDNCPDDSNQSQEDNDNDGVGDVCDENAWETWIMSTPEIKKAIEEYELAQQQNNQQPATDASSDPAPDNQPATEAEELSDSKNNKDNQEITKPAVKIPTVLQQLATTAAPLKNFSSILNSQDANDTNTADSASEEHQQQVDAINQAIDSSKAVINSTTPEEKATNETSHQPTISLILAGGVAIAVIISIIIARKRRNL